MVSLQPEGVTERTVQTTETWVGNLVQEEMKETRRELNSNFMNDFLNAGFECACEEKITKDNYSDIVICAACSPEKQKYYCKSDLCQLLKDKSHKKKQHEPEWIAVKSNQFTDNDVELIYQSREKINKYYKKLMVPSIVEDFQKTENQLNVTRHLGQVASLAVQGIRAVMSLETSCAVFSKLGWKVTIKTAKKMADESAKKFLKQAIGGTAVVQAITCGIEMGWLFKGYIMGEITGIQLAKKLGKCIVNNASSFAGCLGGMKLGASLGSCMGPWGTFICGLIGAAIGGAFAGYFSDKLYEKFMPTNVDDDEKNRAEQIKMALQHFCFLPNELKDLDEMTVRKRYRKLAKYAHPDSKNRGGSNEKFLLLQMHFATLLAYVDGISKKEKTVQKAQKYLAITYKNLGY